MREHGTQTQADLGVAPGSFVMSDDRSRRPTVVCSAGYKRGAHVRASMRPWDSPAWGTSFLRRTFIEQFLQPLEFGVLPVEHLQVKRDPRQRAVQFFRGRYPEAVDRLADERVPSGLLGASGPSRAGRLGPGNRRRTWGLGSCGLRDGRSRERCAFGIARRSAGGRWFWPRGFCRRRLIRRGMIHGNHQLPHDIRRNLDQCPASRAQVGLPSAHNDPRSVPLRERSRGIGLCAAGGRHGFTRYDCE